MLNRYSLEELYYFKVFIVVLLEFSLFSEEKYLIVLYFSFCFLFKWFVVLRNIVRFFI